MIRANSENVQTTIITLTETELEGIYGGCGHNSCYQESDSCGNNDRFGFRGGDSFGFRSSERFNFRNSERFSFRGSNGC
jgi:hypothetical protein